MEQYSQRKAFEGDLDRLKPSIQAVSYRTIGQFTAILDYLIIISTCFVAGYVYESIILQGHAASRHTLALRNVSAIVFVTSIASAVSTDRAYFAACTSTRYCSSIG